MSLISIVMPVYNAGKFLPVAIESILGQTYKDFELIIIDDGSTDESYGVAENYAKKDGRIRLYREMNQGICAARNYALALAQGKYIVFCDHDDEYVESFLECAILSIRKYSADATIFGYKYHKCFNGKKEVCTVQTYPNKIFNEEDIKREYCSLRGYWYRVWGAMYSAGVIKANDLFFDTDIKYGGEDIAFNADFLNVAKKVVCEGEVGYVHYQREKSSTSAKFDVNRLTTIEKQLEKDLVFCTHQYDSEEQQRSQYLYLCGMQLWTFLEKLNYVSCPYRQIEKRFLVKRFVNKYITPKISLSGAVFGVFKYSKKYGIIMICCFFRAYGTLLAMSKFKRG